MRTSMAVEKRGVSEDRLPEKCQAEVYEQVGAAAGDEEDAEGWHWRIAVLLVLCFERCG